MSGARDNGSRLAELLCDAALVGLSAAESRELKDLLRTAGVQGDERLELAAAAAALAIAPEPAEAMPPALADQIVADFSLPTAELARPEGPEAWVVPLEVPADAAPAPRAPAPLSQANVEGGVRRWVGPAIAVAAALVVGVGIGRGVQGPGAPPSAPAAPLAARVAEPVGPAPLKPKSAAQARAELLATASDVMRIEWSSTEDAAAKGASGDLVWSPSLQRGYMRFSGLSENDASRARYQLWIFDQDRDDRFPVDGGLFDVRGADTVVPIDAKLKVRSAALFAVTVEPPEGVVVSERERIVLTAKPTE